MVWYASNAQTNIAFYEALAQVLLLLLRTEHSGASSVGIAVKQWCDNMPAVGAIAKLHTTSKPLCWALQALAYVSFKHKAEVFVSHLSGVKNVWADALSRPEKFDSWIPSFATARRKEPKVKALCDEVWGWCS
jgi:hypothetical protein